MQYEFMMPSVQEIVAAYILVHGREMTVEDLDSDDDGAEDEDAEEGGGAEAGEGQQ